MNENILLVEEKDGVMVLSLNRPQVMNSLNFPLLQALKEQVESVAGNRPGPEHNRYRECCLGG